MTVQAFLLGHLEALARTFEVTVVANAHNSDFLGPLHSTVRYISMPLERKVQPYRDMLCFLRLTWLLASGGFFAVHSVTPKAGLLAMMASWVAGVPVRIHWFTGQVWATRQNPVRSLLRYLDLVMAALATHVLVDSPSQRDFLAAEGVATREKMRVLGKGSISGVDLTRFRPDPVVRREVREELDIPSGGIVFLFVGRCTFDKGLLDLARAFDKVAVERSDSYLLLVGPDEDGVVPEVLSACTRGEDRIRRVEFTRNPERFMNAADVFCLPSYREGFGSVVIEAAAVGVPAIGSRIYGVTDAIEEGRTGLLHEAHDVEGLLGAMRLLAADESYRKALGTQAQERAKRDFAREAVTAELIEFYGRAAGRV
jgi:glycosyltransferase involved in cell wall biosynthesis